MSRAVHMRNDTLIVDGIDYKRMARKIKQMAAAGEWVAPPDIEKAMEVAAKLLGYDSIHAIHHAAKQTSSNTNAAPSPYNL